MPGGTDGFTYPEVKGIIVGQNIVRWADSVIKDIFIGLRFQKPSSHPDAFSDAAHGVGMLEILVVE